MFLRRIGPDPHARGGEPTSSAAAKGCPDLWELRSGEFAVIGIDRTKELAGQLPPSATCGPDERIVVVPRHLLIEARGDIPTK